MKAAAAELYLQCHRPGGRNESVVQKAVRFAENETEMQRKLREQTEFDERVMSAVHAIEPPEDLRQRLAARIDGPSAASAKSRPQFTVPIILTMVCGILSIIGLLVVMEMDHLAHFPGREAAEKMIDTANSMSGIELEPINGLDASQVGDWFYMHGYESYVSPDEVSRLKVVGVRVLRIDGKSVGQAAIDQHDCILYTFRASDFDNDIMQKPEWTIFDHEGWAAALRRREDICSLLIFRGTTGEMEKFLQSLH
jgi:hypothetical protein